MTEHDWQTSGSPVAMLAHLNADGCARKPLLYALALCGWHADLLTPTLRIWEGAVERVLDGELPAHSLADTRDCALYEANCLAYLAGRPPAARAFYSVLGDAINCPGITGRADSELDVRNQIPPAALEVVRCAAAAFVRDIYGNPFRPVAFAPAWRTDTAVALARAVEQSRDFSALPILADALQDAGCDNDDTLNHCRDSSLAHVRGCWVVDLVLNKS
jgi:hypothetical protein